jgi:hypothetical protein
MKSRQPVMAHDEHRLLKFRPRTSDQVSGYWDDLGSSGGSQESIGLSRYERGREDPDDFRHRMLANVAALAFTVALTAIGIWLALSIADLRKTQDCVLMGRRDCAHIGSPRN